MTVKEGEREDVPIEEKMKLLNPLLTHKYHEHLFKNSHSDKGNQSCLGTWDMWMGVSNLAETIIKLQEVMDLKNGNEKNGIEKNGNEKKELDTDDVHYQELSNQVD